MRTSRGVCVFLITLLTVRIVGAAGELELRVVDAASSEPIAVQMKLWDQRQRLIRPRQLTQDGDWLVFDGRAVLKLAPGSYTFRIERGLEYRDQTGHFIMQSGAADNHQVALTRFVEMRSEGWWSGDLEARLETMASVPLRVLAADLDYVPLVAHSNDAARIIAPNQLGEVIAALGTQHHVTADGWLDRRDGGSVSILFGLADHEGITIPRTRDPWPAPYVWTREQRQRAVETPLHVHVVPVTAWDLPVWVALGQVDSVGLLHPGLKETSSEAMDVERPRDTVLFPPPSGLGRWSQQVYFKLLEAGLRIPPGAGSGADTSSNRLGYHRTYVYCADSFSVDRWWEGLREGRVVITNGPLLRPRVNGELPGHTFSAPTGGRVELEVGLNLSTRDKIHYLEIIQNGRPVQQVRLADWAAAGGKLPPVVFDASGWMLVRAVADDETTYRIAMTAPYYVQIGGRPRISRESAQFFLDWIYERAREIRRANLPHQQDILLLHREARDFWQQRLEQATAP